VNVVVAFGAGLLSFVSPCVLPLVPAFLADLTGAAVRGERVERTRALVHASAFVLGFSAVFTALWLAIAVFDAIAGDLIVWAQRVGGAILIVLGLHLAGVITLPFLAMTRQASVGGVPGSVWRSFGVGLSFGAGWTPCVGPYLAAILTLLLSSADLAAGGVLLFAYALGLGLPFLAAAIALDRSRGLLGALQRRARVIEIVGGTLVVAMGVLLVSGRFTQIAGLLNFLSFA
jgi:cytochrome c-type biogenesis protein